MNLQQRSLTRSRRWPVSEKFRCSGHPFGHMVLPQELLECQSWNLFGCTDCPCRCAFIWAEAESRHPRPGPAASCAAGAHHCGWSPMLQVLPHRWMFIQVRRLGYRQHQQRLRAALNLQEKTRVISGSDCNIATSSMHSSAGMFQVSSFQSAFRWLNCFYWYLIQYALHICICTYACVSFSKCISVKIKNPIQYQYWYQYWYQYIHIYVYIYIYIYKYTFFICMCMPF